MSTDRGGGITARLILGGGLMLLGTVFLLDELGIVDFDDAIRWWPLVPILLGLNLILRPGGGAARAFGTLLVVGGVWQLLYDFELIEVEIWDAWPVLLITFGAWIVWRSLSYGEQLHASHGPTARAGDPPAVGADTLSAFAFLGHVQKASASKHFRGADATAIMGGCTIDLRGADVDAEGAVIDAFAFWGGIDVLVPDDWVVSNKVLPLLAGAEDLSRPAPGADKQLLVRGTAIMAGVKIANNDD